MLKDDGMVSVAIGVFVIVASALVPCPRGAQMIVPLASVKPTCMYCSADAAGKHNPQRRRQLASSAVHQGGHPIQPLPRSLQTLNTRYYTRKIVLAAPSGRELRRRQAHTHPPKSRQPYTTHTAVIYLATSGSFPSLITISAMFTSASLLDLNLWQQHQRQQ